uniref:5'-deoxynucleotidase n=1 Tax=Gracilinema caldarium TaxID=215591 RepID=A0A7C3I089_9SPIR
MKRKFHDGEERLFRRGTKGSNAYAEGCDTGSISEPRMPGTQSADTQSAETQPTEALLRSFIRMMDLKGLYRQGWLKRGVPENRAESVADHSFGTALLALLLAERLKASPEFLGLNSHRCIEMALVHELGEVYVGDITPVDGVSREEKYVREREAFIKVVESLPNRDRLLELWEDFEAGRSPEARFVRQLDRLEMGLQAALLKAEGYQRMDEFLESAHRTVTQPDLKALLILAETKAGDTPL